MSSNLSEKIRNCYFYFTNYAFPIYGKRGAVIYDLLTRDVYKVRKDFLEVLDKRNTVGEKIAEWEKKGNRQVGLIQGLEEIIKAGIGFTDDSVIFVDKIRIPFKEEDIEALEETGLGTLSIRIIGTCNLNCRNCNVEKRLNCVCFKDGKGNIELNVLKHVFNEAEILRFHTIKLYGGEPFLHGDIIEILRYLSRRYFKKIEIFTNGTLIDNNLANELSRIKQISLSIIVFGVNEQVHDSITGKEGSWEQTFRNIERLSRKEIKLKLHLFIMRENEDILNEAKNIFAAKDYQYVIDIIKPRSAKQEGKMISKSKFEENAVIRDPRFAKINLYKYFKNQEWNSCWAFNASIDVEGEIKPCLWADVKVGNIMNNSIRDVLRTKKLSRYWKLSKNEISECKCCEYRFLCPDCRVAAMCYSGSLRSKYPYCRYNPKKSTWNEALPDPVVLGEGENPGTVE